MNSCRLPLTIAYHLPAFKAEQLSIVHSLSDDYLLINLENHEAPIHQAVHFLAPDFFLVQPPQLSLYQGTFGLLQIDPGYPKAGHQVHCISISGRQPSAIQLFGFKWSFTHQLFSPGPAFLFATVAAGTSLCVNPINNRGQRSGGVELPG